MGGWWFLMPEMFRLFLTTVLKKIKTNGDILGSKEKYLGPIIRLLDPPFNIFKIEEMRAKIA